LEFRDDRPHRVIATAVASSGGKRRADVFEQTVDAKVLGEQPAEVFAIGRRVVFRHE
jgi:hypothetical protein